MVEMPIYMQSLKFAKRNIRRTPYQAVAATIVMFLTFLVLLLFFIVSFGSQRLIQFIESKPQAIAFFKDNTTDSDVAKIKDTLEKTGKIKDLKYVTKDDALKIYQDLNKDKPILLELVTANMLPTSLEVSTNTPEDLEPIADLLHKEPVVDEIVYPKDVVQTLTKYTMTARFTGIAIATFLVIFAVLLLLMIIGFKIRIRRNEIEIMRLLGASDWFIRMPFLLEGVFYGVGGAFFAWASVYALFWYFTPFLQLNLTNIPQEVIPLPIPFTFMGILLLASCFVGAVIGTIGSYGAVRRYLRL